MTPADAREGREVARLLTTTSHAVVLGTFGLVLHGVLDAAHAADVDVLADLDHVPGIVGHLLARGYAVTSWQDPITALYPLASALLELLRGRVYVRGARSVSEGSAPLVIDVTYEGIDNALWRSDSVVVDGVCVASVARIVALKRARNEAKDRRVLALMDQDMDGE